MDLFDLPEHPGAAGLAARGFADALDDEALAGRTARLEAILAPDAGLETLLAVERALALAWAGATPCELVWATGAAPQTLALRAFDEAGRLLLARGYRCRDPKHV